MPDPEIMMRPMPPRRLFILRMLHNAAIADAAGQTGVRRRRI
jgi:hypothetical protein